ncbi:MAG: PAS domain S-box protein [Verrucomicrobiota bacterium]
MLNENSNQSGKCSQYLEALADSYDHLPIAVNLFDSHGKRLFTNHAYETLFESDHQVLNSRFITDSIEQDEKGDLQNLCDQWLSGALNDFVSECRCLTKRGSTIWCRLTAKSLKQGGHGYFLLIFEDITFSKELSTKLELSEKKYKTLYEESPVMHMNLDPETAKIINCNNMLVHKLGYHAKEDLIGKKIFSIYGEECLEEARKAFETFRREGKLVDKELSLKHKDGRGIPVVLKVAAVKDSEGKILHSSSTCVDITERKRAEKKYLSKNAAFEAVLEGTLAGYWDWFIQDDQEYLSPAFKRMFGYEDHEMENHPSSWQKIIYPDDLPGVFELFDQHVTSKGEVPFHNEVRYFHKDGSIVWVFCRGKVIEWDREGRPVRMVGSHIDITPLKEIQVKLLESNKELEQFAYIASHDLQEPLRSIKNFSELLAVEYGDKLEGEAVTYLEFLTRASNRMSHLIQALLDYSRLGKNLRLEEIDCNMLVDEVSEDMSATIESQKAMIQIYDLPKVTGDRSMLRLLFQNLLSNAIKFRQNDHGVIVSISSTSDQTHWIFSVKDNGIGISSESQEKIFQIFKRLHSQSKYEGSGIGLAHCRKITEFHGGRIWVDSELGRGSNFRFSIARNTSHR